MARSAIRQNLRKLAPPVYDLARDLWCRHMDRRYENIAAKVIARCGLKVMAGPFAGMDYISQAFYSGLVPKIIGCYEDELDTVWQRVLKNDYSAIVDVGCAEGYYAVGLARCFPGKTVYAFDCDDEARKLCDELARANDVEHQVVIGGACGIEELRVLPLQRAFLLCDCEGCELDLLEPEFVPELKQCDILVELHDFVDARISRVILARFAPTHDVVLIPSAQRDPARFPAINFLPRADQALAVNDGRAEPLQWAFLTVKNSVPITVKVIQA